MKASNGFQWIWRIAISPHPAIQDAHVRSRTGVLSVVLILSTILNLLFLLAVLPAVFGLEDILQRPEWWFALASFVVSLVLWLVSRTRHPRIAAVGICGFATVGTWTITLVLLNQLPDSRELIRTLVPIVLAQLFTGTFLPFRFTLWIGTANLTGLVLLPWIAFHLPPQETIGVSLILSVAVATSIAMAWLHRRDLMAIRKEQAERLQAEEALERSRRMEALGRLAGGVAHDFNNMLTSILARIDAIRLQDPSLAVARELDGIETAADRAASLVHRLLDHGRPQARKKSTFDLARVLNDTADLIRPSLPMDFTLHLALPPERIHCTGDPEQIGQVLVNLMGNARDAIHEHRTSGRIEVRLDPIDTETGKLARIRVLDDGPGLPPTVLEHLFEPFFTTKPSGRGTGLGLWNSLGTAKAHGGEILAENRPEGGASMTLLLPMVQVTSSESTFPHPSPPPSRHGQGRILLVDDEEAIREHGAMSLRECGFDVVLAGTGEKALERFETDILGFDLVVLDLSLPGISGKEVCHRMQSRSPDLPILIVSGFDPGENDSPDHIESVAGHLVKPFRMAQLTAEVRKICSSAARSGSGSGGIARISS
ncbi:MAG: response regulator [Fibrobacteria bacterium]|nr:response regulator [Fibrobacteria bacterium]